MKPKPVVVIGAGLSGLCCARELLKQHRDVIVLEAQDDIGGRVRTDHVDGFLLDRGFQVLQTAYPEAAPFTARRFNSAPTASTLCTFTNVAWDVSGLAAQTLANQFVAFGALVTLLSAFLSLLHTRSFTGSLPVSLSAPAGRSAGTTSM